MQVEKCDTFAGFVSIQSLAGGTGGGVGQLKKHLLLRSHVSVQHMCIINALIDIILRHLYHYGQVPICPRL